jgi:hypothetical protein
MAELHVSELFSHESQLAFKNGNWVRFILTSIAAQVTVGFLAIVSGVSTHHCFFVDIISCQLNFITYGLSYS